MKHRKTVEMFWFNVAEWGGCIPPDFPPAPVTGPPDKWEKAYAGNVKEYFWNPRTRERCWKKPEQVAPPSDTGSFSCHDGILRVGTRVEVFSSSRQAWFPGYVDTVRVGMATVAFQLPGMSPFELAKKELPLGDTEIRPLADGDADAISTPPNVNDAQTAAAARRMPEAASGGHPRNAALLGNTSTTGRTSDVPRATTRRMDVQSGMSGQHCHGYPGLGNSSLPSRSSVMPEEKTSGAPNAEPEVHAFTVDEKFAYTGFFKQAMQSLRTDQMAVAKYLASSRLPRRTLKEVWQATNPTMRQTLNQDEFFMSCRLIGHCQAMQKNGSTEELKVLEDGGHDLRVRLREFWRVPPAKIPVFFDQVLQL